MTAYNRTDICEAYWCFARFICTRLAAYAVYTRLYFVGYGSPRPILFDGPKHLTTNGKRIYMRLVREFYG